MPTGNKAKTAKNAANSLAGDPTSCAYARNCSLASTPRRAFPTQTSYMLNPFQREDPHTANSLVAEQRKPYAIKPASAAYFCRSPLLTLLANWSIVRERNGRIAAYRAGLSFVVSGSGGGVQCGF